MKKVALTIALLAIVVSGLVGGITMAVVGPPGIWVSPTSCVPGASVTINGAGWKVNTIVQVYMDEVDASFAHLLASPTAKSNGSFSLAFTMTATTVGNHQVIAVQGATQASATITLTATTPMDERTVGLLPDIKADIDTLKGRLTEARANNLDLLPGMDTKVDDLGAKVQSLMEDMEQLMNSVALLDSKLDGVISGRPFVTSGEVSDILDVTARLSGNLTGMGTASSVTVSFEYGTVSGALDSETPGQTLANPGGFECSLHQLQPNTIYYYRAKAVGNGTNYGAEKSFTTKQHLTLITLYASNFTTISATLTGAVVYAEPAFLYFEYDTDSSLSTPSASDGIWIEDVGSVEIIYQINVVDLEPNTTYYFRAAGMHPPGGTEDRACGEVGSFTTPAPIPASVTTDEATDVQATRATLNGSLTGMGSANLVTVLFVWSTSPGGAWYETPGMVMESTGEFAYVFGLGTLNPGTTYYFRAMAMGDGTSWGEEKSFTTPT